MSYTGKRTYNSRREKYFKSIRFLRIVFIFASIGIVVLLYKNRFLVKGWLESVIY